MVRLVALALALGFIGLAACGTTGAVGDACSSPGKTTECATGNVCDTTDAKAVECLKVCKTTQDCASGESCDGVASTDLSACRPVKQASHGG